MKTDREKDGWSGPVQTVTVEMADFLEDGGTLILSPRVPLFTLTYDEQGRRVGKTIYHPEHSDSKENDYVTKYDAESNIREQTYYQHGMFQYKVIPTYEDKNLIKEVFHDLMGNPRYMREQTYDDHGNPIEMIYSEANGNIINKLQYENEYDSAGNLIKVTIFQWMTSNGESFYNPSSTHFQTIIYY